MCSSKLWGCCGFLETTSKTVFDVVSKNPQNPHIPKQMNPATVQKHGTEEGEDFLRQCQIMAGIRVGINGGDDSKARQHLVQMRTESYFVQKNQNIDDDNA